ncbi:MAG: hypothetical protein KatS3mg096_152 [Candidatus Parcubacteria bacterium]|nr:MAG: hypothetical protein KatS3mg096_152 [Candidatus Parcubacteria bacterium]
MNKRLKKQIIYGTIIFLFFAVFTFLIYLKLKGPTVASCFDGKKNQDEEGIDCGGSCPPCELKTLQPLKIYPTQFLVYENSMDIIGLIENPNSNLALKKLKYYFEIYDIDNVLRATTTIRETNLEPEIKKYLLEIKQPKPEFIISGIKLKILEPLAKDWLKKEKTKFSVSYYNEKLVQEDDKWKIKLTLFNQSYLTQNLEVIGLVYNKNNTLVGVGKTFVSLASQEVKEIYISLPSLLTQPAGFEIYFQQ